MLVASQQVRRSCGSTGRANRLDSGRFAALCVHPAHSVVPVALCARSLAAVHDGVQVFCVQSSPSLCRNNTLRGCGRRCHPNAGTVWRDRSLLSLFMFLEL